MKKIKLNLGCGTCLVKGFINVDKAFSFKEVKSKKGLFGRAHVEKGAEFVQADMLNLPFKDNYADYIETVDAIEHIPFRQVPLAFNEIYRVLKKGGKLVLMTTDFNELARLWSTEITNQPFDWVKYHDLMEVIYGNQIGGDAEVHKTAFNIDYLALHLQSAGFEKEKILYTIFPTSSNHRPNLQTQTWPDPACVRTTMIYVEAIK